MEWLSTSSKTIKNIQSLFNTAPKLNRHGHLLIHQDSESPEKEQTLQKLFYEIEETRLFHDVCSILWRMHRIYFFLDRKKSTKSIVFLKNNKNNNTSKIFVLPSHVYVKNKRLFVQYQPSIYSSSWYLGCFCWHACIVFTCCTG